MGIKETWVQICGSTQINMCIIISARTELKQNLDWNRIKFPLFQRGQGGFFKSNQ
jgi:hypothetical protein